MIIQNEKPFVFDGGGQVEARVLGHSPWGRISTLFAVISKRELKQKF